MFQKVPGIEKKLCLRGEYHDFLWKICCLTVTTNFVGEPVRVSLNSGIEKFLLEKVMSRISIESLLSQSTDNFRKEPFCSSQNFWYRKNLWIKAREGEREGGSEGGREGGTEGGREGRIITFFCQNILSDSA